MTTPPRKSKPNSYFLITFAGNVIANELLDKLLLNMLTKLS